MLNTNPETNQPDEYIPSYPKEYMDKVQQETTTFKEIHTELRNVLNNLRKKEVKQNINADMNILNAKQKALLLKAPDPYIFLKISNDYLTYIQMKQESQAFISNISKSREKKRQNLHENDYKANIKE